MAFGSRLLFLASAFHAAARAAPPSRTIRRRSGSPERGAASGKPPGSAPLSRRGMPASAPGYSAVRRASFPSQQAFPDRPAGETAASLPEPQPEPGENAVAAAAKISWVGVE